jgi:hypothetical protein
MSSTGQKNKAIDIKKTSTLENKHRLKIKEFETEKDDLINLQNELISISVTINELDKIREKFTTVEQKKRADLLDKKDEVYNDMNKKILSEVKILKKPIKLIIIIKGIKLKKFNLTIFTFNIITTKRKSIAIAPT